MPYARAMLCPVLEYARLLQRPRVHGLISGTHVGYSTPYLLRRIRYQCVIWCYAAHRMCYALSGTEVGYGGSRQLRWGSQWPCRHLRSRPPIRLRYPPTHSLRQARYWPRLSCTRPTCSLGYAHTPFFVCAISCPVLP
eukprot:774556-Rhodomonas_salina.1